MHSHLSSLSSSTTTTTTSNRSKFRPRSSYSLVANLQHSTSYMLVKSKSKIYQISSQHSQHNQMKKNDQTIKGHHHYHCQHYPNRHFKIESFPLSLLQSIFSIAYIITIIMMLASIFMCLLIKGLFDCNVFFS